MENLGKLSPDVSTNLMINQFRFCENSFFKDTKEDGFDFALRNSLHRLFIKNHCGLTLLSLVAYLTLSAVLYSSSPAISLLFLVFFMFSLYRLFTTLIYYHDYLLMSNIAGSPLIMKLEKNPFSQESINFLKKIDKEDALRLFYDFYDSHPSEQWRSSLTTPWLNTFYQNFSENKTDGYIDVMFVLSRVFEGGVKDFSEKGMLTD